MKQSHKTVSQPLEPHSVIAKYFEKTTFGTGAENRIAASSPPTMSHYQRAPGQPPCKFGAACTRKKADHYRSLDHPPNHPKLLHAANMKHQHQQLDHNAVALDRSSCALQGRDGDDPSTATYTCAGCGSKIVGFGRWRNHMKRANKRGGGEVFLPMATGTTTAVVSKKESFRALAVRNLAAHREHDPASLTYPPVAEESAQLSDADREGASILTAPAKASAMQQAAREAPLQSRVEGKAVWRLSGKEKRALAEAAARGEAPRAVAAEFASRTVPLPAWRPSDTDALRSEDASERGDGEEKQPVGKRWLASAPGKSKKRQRKFY